MSGLFNERAVRLVFLGLRDPRRRAAVPRLHRILGEVGRTLDAPELPELYVVANPVPSALTIGMNKPFIVLNSGLVDLLDEDELRFVVAHELGHAMSGHAVYQTLLQRLLQFSGVLTAIPLGGLGVRAIVAALYEWSRKSELLRRPGRAARDPGPGDGLPGAHEARQRRPPRRPRRDVVLRAGPGVRRRRPARLGAQDAAGREPVAPVPRRTRHRAAPLGRLG